MRQYRRAVLCLAWTWVACSNKQAPPAQAGNTIQAPKEDSSQKRQRAKEMFAKWSHDLEKLGSDDRVDGAHMIEQLDAIIDVDDAFVPAAYNRLMAKSLIEHTSVDTGALKKLGEQDGSFAPVQENLAALSVEAGDISPALSLYQDIVQKYPKDQTSRLALARIYYSQKKYSDAITLCRAVLQRQADAVEAFRVLALSYFASGNVPMTELIVARGLRISGGDEELEILQAQIALNKDDLGEGVAKLKQVVRQDPNRLDVRAKLAEIAVNYRDFGNAAQQYEAIMRARPDALAVKVNLGVCYKGMGRYDDADKLYKEALAKEPDNAPALWNTGVLYLRHLRKYDEAEAALHHFKQVASADDERAGQVDNLLVEAEKLKTDLEAKKAREEAEKAKKDAIDKACADAAAGKVPDVTALGGDPARIETAWQLMGQAQQAIGANDIPKGEALVQCAFAIIPTTPAANTQACAPMHVMWTQILYQLQRIDEAAKSNEVALKCDPNNPDAQLIAQQLGELQKQKGEVGAAPDGASTKDKPDAAGKGKGDVSPIDKTEAPADDKADNSAPNKKK